MYRKARGGPKERRGGCRCTLPVLDSCSWIPWKPHRISYSFPKDSTSEFSTSDQVDMVLYDARVCIRFELRSDGLINGIEEDVHRRKYRYSWYFYLWIIILPKCDQISWFETSRFNIFRVTTNGLFTFSLISEIISVCFDQQDDLVESCSESYACRKRTGKMDIQMLS